MLDYPSETEEAEILRMHAVQEDLDGRIAELQPVTTAEEIAAISKECDNVTMAPKLLDYINAVVRMTRNWPQLHLGASPRAGLALLQGARRLAAFRGRDYAVPDDVVEIALPTLRHRVILSGRSRGGRI